jgi:hypothetical protein
MRQFVGHFPAQMQSLPVDRRGFPVPWFVEWRDGEPLFPVMNVRHLGRAIKEGRCWCCGQKLWKNRAFVIGPMCCVNRLSAEPPNHVECAEFAALNCPFMAHPKVGRAPLQGILAEAVKPAGLMIERNPGVACVWITESHKVEWQDMPGGGRMPLFRMGPAKRFKFYARSRPAFRHEVDIAVATGLPALEQAASGDDAYNGDDSASKQLKRQVAAFAAMLDEHDWPIAADVDLAALGFEEARA